jgi:hypothetical protein
MSKTHTDRRLAPIVAVLAGLAWAPAGAQSPAPALTDRGNLQLDLACGPRAAFIPPSTALQITGSLEDRNKSLFGPGDRLVVNAGTAQGLQAGQEFFVRRLIATRETGRLASVEPVGIHTVGWIRLDQVQNDTSVASIVHACDGIEPGDFLESFAMPEVPTPLEATGEPDYEGAARILFGDERREASGNAMLAVIDRGSDHGIRPGERFTVFRRAASAGAQVITLGKATAMVVQPKTALIRIDEARDVVYAGDLVAPHRHGK